MRNLHHIFTALITVLLLATIQPTMATKAYPGVVEVTQPDGSKLKIQVFGDEFFNYRTTTDGYVVAQDAQGYYCYASYDMSGVHISSSRVGRISPMGAVTRSRGVDATVFETLRNRNMQARDTRLTEPRSQGAAPSAAKFEKVLVLLVEFKDLKFTTPNPEGAFQRMLNMNGYSENGGTGSAKDFFHDNSMGKYSPTIDVFNRVTLPYGYAYYGENNAVGDDANPRAMVAQACEAAVAKGLRLSDYDTDGDGVVDNVFIYYAGHNEAEGASSNTIWPHRWTVSANIGGVSLRDYACTSELRGAQGSLMAGIGTFCHEFGHVLGLPDLYDSNGLTNGRAVTMGSLATMDAGNYNNEGCTPPYYTAIEREYLNWMTPTNITKSGTYTIQPINNNVAYRYDTPNPGEYYLLECRSEKGWDAYIQGRGMLVYHIDKSNNMVNGLRASETWARNVPNGSATHQCADLVEASGVENSRAAKATVFFPGSLKVTSLSSFSTPSSIKRWSGDPVDINIQNISLLSSGDVTIKVGFDPTGYLYGTILNKNNEPISGATVIMRRELQTGEEQPESMQFVATTKTSGQYTIPNASLGTYTMIVQKEGFVTEASKTITIGIGKNECNFTLTPGQGIRGLAQATYQRMIRLNWSGILANKIMQKQAVSTHTKAKWRQVGQGSYTYAVQESENATSAYMSGLEPGTAYEVVIEDENNSTVHTEVVITNPIKSDLVIIDQSKSRYAMNDRFDLTLANIKSDDLAAVTWYKDDAKLPDGTLYVALTANCQVRAEVKHADGSASMILKQINLLEPSAAQ